MKLKESKRIFSMLSRLTLINFPFNLHHRLMI